MIDLVKKEKGNHYEILLLCPRLRSEKVAWGS